MLINNKGILWVFNHYTTYLYNINYMYMGKLNSELSMELLIVEIASCIKNHRHSLNVKFVNYEKSQYLLQFPINNHDYFI